MAKTDVTIYEKLRFATIMAVIGGFLDVYTYILHDGVFANAQTGNIVLIGVTIANGHIFEIVKYVYPILAFILGVLISEIFKQYKNAQWPSFILILEILVLFCIGLFSRMWSSLIVTSIISFISSVQISSFRSLRSAPYSTTMMTGNLRSCVESWYRYLKTHDREFKYTYIRYLVVLLCFILGAGLGSVLVHSFQYTSIWICCALQLLLLVLTFVEHRTKARGQ